MFIPNLEGLPPLLIYLMTRQVSSTNETVSEERRARKWLTSLHAISKSRDIRPAGGLYKGWFYKGCRNEWGKVIGA